MNSTSGVDYRAAELVVFMKPFRDRRGFMAVAGVWHDARQHTGNEPHRRSPEPGGDTGNRVFVLTKATRMDS